MFALDDGLRVGADTQITAVEIESAVKGGQGPFAIAAVRIRGSPGSRRASLIAGGAANAIR